MTIILVASTRGFPVQTTNSAFITTEKAQKNTTIKNKYIDHDPHLARKAFSSSNYNSTCKQRKILRGKLQKFDGLVETGSTPMFYQLCQINSIFKEVF